MQAPTLLLVVGMHRSGTSSVAGLYNCLGADIGRSIMGPAADNPKGFFENTRIVDIHDRLLMAFGRAWDVDLEMPDGWLDAPETLAAQTELYNIVAEEFDPASPAWLVKDPRLCLLLDMWRDIADRAQRQIRSVIVFRHPEEIAASLERREDMPFPVAIALQIFYWRALKSQKIIPDAMGLNHNALLAAKSAVVEHLNTAAGGLFPEPTAAQVSRAEEFFSEKLITHTASGSRSPLGALYNELFSAAQPALSKAEVAIFLARVNDLPGAFMPETHEVAKRRQHYINRLRLSASRLNMTLAQARLAYAKLQQEANNAREQTALLEKKILEIGAGFHADVNTLRNRAAILEGKLSRSEERRQATETAEKRTQAKLSQLEQEHGALRLELRRTTDHATLLNAQLQRPIRLAAKHVVWSSARFGYRNLPVSERRKQLLISRYGSVISRYMPGVPELKERYDEVESAPMDAAQTAAGGIAFPVIDEPLISIVVPVYNQLGYTLRCLHALATHESSHTFEVIVMDDVSSDPTAEVLPKIVGLRCVRNEENLGFLRNCNKAAGIAKGKFIVFLNNDTVVMPGWLDALYDTFQEHGDIGLAGSKLVYPDGRLQEAGGIVWRDASGWNWGRLADPHHPRFNFARDADYVSGASIMVPAELFQSLGGFDERYVPAYYEDTDLAFMVRDRGLRVMYQPKSVVIHFEGISSGKDLTKGIKRYQAVNKNKFFDKWQHVLATHGMPEDGPERSADRRWDRHVLIVDAVTPTPDQDSGSVDMMNLIKILISLGRRVHFVPQTNYVHAGRYTEQLQRMGVECVYFPPYKTLEHYLSENSRLFDTVILCREPIASHVFKTVSKHLPNAKVIFYTVDLHYLRTERQAALTNDAEIADDAARTKESELALIEGSDVSILLSEFERDLVGKECPEAVTAVLPLIREIPGRAGGFGDRRDVVFIGSFNHPPNVDAVRWLIDEIWPKVRAKDPSIRLRICGSNMPPYVEKMCREADGIEAVGFVPDLATVFNACRLSIAPLRYGAGLKGKLATSFGYGVPCIATPVAIEGMSGDGLDHCRLEGQSEQELADLVVKYHSDEDAWERASDTSIAYVTQHFSYDVIREKVAEILKSLDEKAAG